MDTVCTGEANRRSASVSRTKACITVANDSSAGLPEMPEGIRLDETQEAELTSSARKAPQGNTNRTNLLCGLDWLRAAAGCPPILFNIT